MKYVILFLSAFVFIPLMGQPELSDPACFTNHVFKDNIKTVQLFNEKWNLSYPFLKLNSSDKLVCNFDLIGDEPESYNYSFIHCDKDWNKSDIFPADYYSGYIENPVEDYSASFNTTVKYIHYKISFPNDKIQLKLSGNYILVVYPSDNPEQPVLTQRFIIYEEAVQIKVDVHRPLTGDDKDTRQQVDFSVSYNEGNFIDPYRNFYSSILQNGRWDNAKKNMKPDFNAVNELKYNTLSDKNIFMGGNEFRYFDIKSIRYPTENVKGIQFVDGSYNVFLTPSENREFKPYFYWKDFNGRYYIAIQEGQNYDIDADYVNAYFTLPSKQVIGGGDMYVSGALSNWNFDNSNRLIYNSAKEQYECTMLLKQGWYNYEYAYLKKGATDGTASQFEGSHYETENDYTVIVYYHNPNGRYDRVAGVLTFNTLNRISN
jgi:hypothetical protein